MDAASLQQVTSGCAIPRHVLSFAKPMQAANLPPCLPPSHDPKPNSNLDQQDSVNHAVDFLHLYDNWSRTSAHNYIALTLCALRRQARRKCYTEISRLHPMRLLRRVHPNI